MVVGPLPLRALPGETARKSLAATAFGERRAGWIYYLEARFCSLSKK